MTGGNEPGRGDWECRETEKIGDQGWERPVGKGICCVERRTELADSFLNVRQGIIVKV